MTYDPDDPTPRPDDLAFVANLTGPQVDGLARVIAATTTVTGLPWSFHYAVDLLTNVRSWAIRERQAGSVKVNENCAPGEISPMVPPRYVHRPETIEEYQALVAHLRERHASIYFAAAEAWRREARWEAHLDAIRERLGVREDSRKLGLILRAIDRLDFPTQRAEGERE